MQSASFGLPQVYQQGFGDPTYPYYNRPLTSFYGQDSWKITPSFTLDYGLRYDLDTQFAPLTTYKKDFAPRVSFAWDPFKDHKTVIRGGYGIFYGPVDVQIPDVDLSLGVVNKNKSAVENSSGAGQVANLSSICGVSYFGYPDHPRYRLQPLQPGDFYLCRSDRWDPAYWVYRPRQRSSRRCLRGSSEQLIACTTPTPGNQCLHHAGCRGARSGIGMLPIAVPIGPLQVVFVNQPGYRPPIAQQASFGIEREIGPGFSISLSGIYSHTQRLPMAIDTRICCRRRSAR